MSPVLPVVLPQLETRGSDLTSMQDNRYMKYPVKLLYRHCIVVRA